MTTLSHFFYIFLNLSISRRDLHRRVGGSCSTHNMKVIFKVAANKVEEDAVARTRQPAINRPRNRVEENSRMMENVRPIEAVSSFRTGLDHGGEVNRGVAGKRLVKQEASTMSGGNQTCPLLLHLLCLLAFWRILL